MPISVTSVTGQTEIEHGCSFLNTARGRNRDSLSALHSAHAKCGFGLLAVLPACPALIKVAGEMDPGAGDQTACGGQGMHATWSLIC